MKVPNLALVGCGEHALKRRCIQLPVGAPQKPNDNSSLILVERFASLLSQFVGKVSQGQANSEVFSDISQILRTRGFALVYSDVAPFLQYNIPPVTFTEVDVGTSQQYVNLTANEVPAGAPLITLLLVPRTYDERIGGFYLVEHFDPNINSPFLNLLYGA